MRVPFCLQRLPTFPRGTHRIPNSFCKCNMGQALCCVSRHTQKYYIINILLCLEGHASPIFSFLRSFVLSFIHPFIYLTNTGRSDHLLERENKISSLLSRSLKLLFKSLLLKNIYILFFSHKAQKAHYIEYKEKL